MSIQKDLKDIAATLNKEFKGNIAGLVVDGMLGDVKGFVSTGCTPLDVLIRGGLPIGRVVEIYGKPSSGKSTLVSSIIRIAQSLGGVAAVIDSEGTWTLDRAIALGVDPTAVLELEANTIEDGFDHIEATIRLMSEKPSLAGKPMVVVYDTIANSPTRNEADPTKTFSDRKAAWAGGISEKARIVRRGIRKLSSQTRDHNIILIFVNQTVEGPNGESTPGGLGIKFQASLRLRLRNAGKVETSEGTIGMVCEAQIMKCKVSGAFPKHDKIQFPLFYDRGIDDARACLEALKEEKGVTELKYASGWFSMTMPDGSTKKFQQANVDQLLAEQPELLDHFRALVRKHLVQPERKLELKKQVA